jgi:hypothetical protein
MMRTICYQIQEVSNKEAEVQMKKFLQEEKKKGLKYVTVLDFYTALHLPFEQINKIMENLEKEGVVGESE